MYALMRMHQRLYSGKSYVIYFAKQNKTRVKHKNKRNPYFVSFLSLSVRTPSPSPIFVPLSHLHLPFTFIALNATVSKNSIIDLKLLHRRTPPPFPKLPRCQFEAPSPPFRKCFHLCFSLYNLCFDVKYRQNIYLESTKNTVPGSFF